MNNAYSSVLLINHFPDFSAPGFHIDEYNHFFKTNNSIINAKASDIEYQEHWGCFSIKCAFEGDEIYRVQNRVHKVNDQNFLVLNEDQYYSSYIFSKEKVESFTLNFTSEFVQEVGKSCLYADEHILDNRFSESKLNIEFIEKLYLHNSTVSPVLFRIKQLVKNFNDNREKIAELYYLLLEKLLLLHKEVNKEINSVGAIKSSTRKELYRRLHYAKDYIDSCYSSEITLHELSRITLMNTAYFLRHFKKYFHATPYQYLINKRMRVAGELISNTQLPVTDVCTTVGYADVSSFAKLFKRYYGFSPEAYRNHLS